MALTLINTQFMLFTWGYISKGQTTSLNYFLDFMTDIFLIDRSMLVNMQGEITKHPLIASYCVTVIPIGLTVNTRETGMTILLLLWRDSYNQKCRDSN